MKLKPMLDEISAKHMFRFAYLANNYRDPFLRQVEQDLGLTRPEVTILFCLANTDGITAKDVADVTRQPKNTLSRGSVFLERKALITRQDDENDRRRSLLFITPKGQELYKKALKVYEDAERCMLSPLDDKDLADLDRVLRKMCIWVAEQNGG